MLTHTHVHESQYTGPLSFPAQLDGLRSLLTNDNDVNVIKMS